jgi:Cu/Zn superoxide dismutase
MCLFSLYCRQPARRWPDYRDAAAELRLTWPEARGIAYHCACTPEYPAPPEIRMPSQRACFAALAAALLLSACSTTTSLDPRTWFAKDTTPAPKVAEVPGVEARLKDMRSGVSGTVYVRESGDLLVVRVVMQTDRSGTYRVVFHDNPNCSSPNAFSAGAPWSPPGASAPPGRLVPAAYAGTDGNVNLVARIRGVRMGDLEKRSVLVFEGDDTTPPRPDVPNNVVACGVFTRSTTLF